MRNKFRPQFIPIYCFALFLIACHNQTYYHSYQPVCKTGWYKNDTLIFTLKKPIINHSTHEYKIGIRHKDSYKFRDLWLTINQDTIHLYLADTQGHWLGNGIGEIRQITFPFTFTPTNDSIKEIRITHIMQQNPLLNLQDIGISIHEMNQ